jgi:hypothetical protein
MAVSDRMYSMAVFSLRLSGHVTVLEDTYLPGNATKRRIAQRVAEIVLAMRPDLSIEDDLERYVFFEIEKFPTMGDFLDAQVRVYAR